VLVAALLSGCGVSSISEVAQPTEKLALVAPAGAGTPSPGATVKMPAVGSVDSLAASAPPPAAVKAATKPGVLASTVTQPSAVAKAAADALTAVAMPGNAGYKIGPLDVLDVSVFKVPDLTKAVQVTEAGTVNYPLVGEIQAAGKTAREVEQMLTSMLGAKYLQKPQVTVFIKEYNSQRVTIEGAIIKPGVYPISGNMTLLQALAVAQGFTPNSDATVVLFRMTDGKRAAARFDLDKIRDGSEPDPSIKAGDVIVAGSSAIKENFNNVIKLLPLASIFALL
jgi:polysaccharide biosynthesis/export protein